jgi:hypothetical protein
MKLLLKALSPVQIIAPMFSAKSASIKVAEARTTLGVGIRP